MLLVSDRGYDDAPGEPEARSLARRNQRCGDARLHVVGAAAVEPVAHNARTVPLLDEARYARFSRSSWNE